MELGTGTLLERGASGGLNGSGCPRNFWALLIREDEAKLPVSSSEGDAWGLNRWPSWAETPGVGERPGSLEVGVTQRDSSMGRQGHVLVLGKGEWAVRGWEGSPTCHSLPKGHLSACGHTCHSP